MRNQSLSGKPTMPSARSAQVYGKIQPMDEARAEARKEMISWIALGLGFIAGVLVFLAFAYAAGPVQA